MSALTTTQKHVASMNALSEHDQTLFEMSESAVRENLAGYVIAGRHLSLIRENKWYRSLGYTSFEAYVIERFDIKRSYAYAIIQSAVVVDNLIADQSVRNSGHFDDGEASAVAIALPSNVDTALPLAKLSPAEQGAVWQGAVEKAKQDNAPMTAVRVQEAVDTHQGKNKPQASVHHPAPTHSAKTMPASKPQADTPQEKTTACDGARRHTLRFTSRAEMTFPNASGEEITIIYEIREEKDDKFHLWRTIKQTLSGSELISSPINVYSSHALAARAAQTHADAAQDTEAGEKRQ